MKEIENKIFCLNCNQNMKIDRHENYCYVTCKCNTNLTMSVINYCKVCSSNYLFMRAYKELNRIKESEYYDIKSNCLSILLCSNIMCPTYRIEDNRISIERIRPTARFIKEIKWIAYYEEEYKIIPKLAEQFLGKIYERNRI